ncbi:DUF4215 domain-containing protein [Patescibacteria group bacterium]
MAAYFYVDDNPNLRKGCPGQINVMLNTEGSNVLAADSTMNFSTAEMSVVNMALNVALPMQTYNQITGTLLELSGARLPATGAFNGNGIYGILDIIPDIAAASVTLNFSPDLNVDNVIAEEITFANIINIPDGAQDGTIAVKDRYNKEVDGVGFCTPDLNPPTVNFILPPNGSGGNPANQPNEIFSIQDDRAGVDISTLSYTIEGVSYTNTSAQTDLSESGGVHRVETTFTSDWSPGQKVDISVYVCDLNTDPAPNCNTTTGHFNIYSPPPPSPVCGDGIVTYTNGEQCDDGNTDNDDGCSAHCFIEIEPVVCPDIPTDVPCPTAGLTIVKDLSAALPPGQLPVVTGVGAATEEEILAGEYPAVGTAIKKGIPGCTREDITKDVLAEFNVEDRYSAKDIRCLEDVEHCMLPFLMHSAYPDANPAGNRYYPDVYLSGERSEPLLEDDSGPISGQSKDAIHFSTREGMLHGFYLDYMNLSPFRPQWNMTRIQIIKTLNWAVFGQLWEYEEEYYAEIGGEQNLGQVRRLAADLTQWWYPRYYNFACDKGVFNCDPMMNFGPDEICSPEWKREIFARYKVYFEGQKQEVADMNEDSDADGLVDYDESRVFLTNPENKDTDADALGDGDEIVKYKSNPKLTDTDFDGLDDGDEVNKYKTNPVLPDTDGDTYPDGIEIREGTDPLDPNSSPVDEDGDGIPDKWELQYGINPQNGVEDFDGDGLSDFFEHRYSTDPTNPDTDGDGLSDADEVLLYGTDPNEYTNLSELGVRITNIMDQMTLTDPRPLLQGFAPLEGMEVEIILRNEFGNEVLLGSAITDVNNAWVFTPEFDILDGEFYLLAKGLDTKNKRILESPLIGVIMNSKLQVSEPQPERLGDTNITEEVLLEGLSIETRDSAPILIGRTGFKNKVIATWQSVLGTSAIVADLAGGEFRIQAPKELAPGPHKVSVYSIRDKDNAMSKVVTVNFEVKEPFAAILRGVAMGKELIFPLWVWTMIFLGAGLLLGGGMWIEHHRKKKKDGKTEKK